MPSDDFDDGDFGDGDFDEDAILELEATIAKLTQGTKAKSDPDSTSLAPATPTPGFASNPEPGSPPKPPSSARDEFDDVDDDVFDAAEDLIASLDQRSLMHYTQAEAETTGAKQQQHSLHNSQNSGDNFDDDFGNDFDFEAVEMAVTQSAACAKMAIPVRDHDGD